jgi:hypothetical protein
MEQRNKRIGLGIMCIGLLAAAFCFWHFQLDGKVVDFADSKLVLKVIVTTLCLVIGLFFGLLFAAGKKVALQLGGGLALLLVISYVVGFLVHH